MTQQQFIDEVAKYVKKYAPQYGIKVYSPVIAQFCLESGYGTTNKVKKVLADGTVDWRHNYAGLKWRDGRCAISNDYFEEGTSEQNANGTSIDITSKFFRFKSLEECVIGYFQFTNIPAYSNLKGVTDPKTYLENIKADKYATDINYVQKNMNVINKWNLTKYDDKKEEINMGYTNSSLVNYTLLSPNCTRPRKNKITKIVIHHMAGNLSVETCGKVFQPTSRKASANYGIDTNGRVGMYVEECNRAWTSGNAAVDNQAITIEVANDGGAPNWHVSDKALKKTIELCVDICKRNDIKQLIFTGDTNGNLVAHRYYQATACPGEYLYSKFPYIADEVNKRLGVSTSRNYLMKGDKGMEVKVLQENLNYLGYSCGAADGDFGAKTDTALRKFQKAYKLTVDGMYGSASKKALEDAVAKKKAAESATSASSSSKKYYRVQSGSFITQANAVKLQNQLKAAGFDAIIKKVGLNHKVQIGAYENKTNAEAMMAKVVAKGFKAFITYC